MPETTGLLAYRNRRGVLLDLAGWDERRDAKLIRTGKTATEQEQHDVFTHTRVTRGDDVTDDEAPTQGDADGWRGTGRTP